MEIPIINIGIHKDVSVGFCMECKEIVPIKSILYIDDLEGRYAKFEAHMRDTHLDYKIKCLKCGKTDFPEPIPPGC